MKHDTLICNITGRSKKYYLIYLQNKIKKFGGLEEYKKYYICREAKKLLKKNVLPEDIQKQLIPPGIKPFEINYIILAKLKLLKPQKKSKKQPLGQVSYKTVKPIQPESFKAWVHEFTGGPNGSFIPLGSTCVRPDLFLNNGRSCNECIYFEHCLCKRKKILK